MGLLTMNVADRGFCLMGPTLAADILTRSEEKGIGESRLNRFH